MEVRRRRRKKKPDMTKLLIAAIAVLAVILIAVICVAVSMRGAEPGQETTGSGSTDATQDTGNASQPTGTEPQMPESIALTVTHALGSGMATPEETAVFEGKADPAKGLTVNGEAVAVAADGSFRCEVALEPGKNELLFQSGEETAAFTVERRYVVASFAPMGDQSYGSGAKLLFEVAARAGSTVTASFNGQEFSLKEANNQLGSGLTEGFSMYTGEYAFPGTNTEDLQLGVITYTATCDGVTETYASGQITCRRSAEILESDPSVTPDYGDYTDVGSGYIVEIVNYSGETFDGGTTDDYSHPTNSYLPKGTVDYCSSQPVVKGDLQYIKMRCGRRVYVKKNNYPGVGKTQVVNCYQGTLPDHNEIGFVSMEEVGNQTVLTLDCLWKAPFYFDLLPQEYLRPDGGSDRSYEVSAYTATYIDITFCYATQFTGTVQIPQGNPIFKSAEVIRQESDCILRLHLNQTGGFYGWDSYYNEMGQLCFQFLKPAKAVAADNAYGADLTGVTIMIDVGHGGEDGGATGTDAAGDRWSESGRNMDLAYALREELESMGATVLFNREGKQTITVDERIMILKDAKPDLCVAIHHNSIAGYPNISGFESYYYYPYGKLAAENVCKYTREAGIYSTTGVKWNNYYVARQTVCPVVLTENGYMSNLSDLNGTLDAAVIARKAAAIAHGVADYFLAINQ